MVERAPTGIRCEVVVIGGGAAGLAAALQLARVRRSVVVVDAGAPRNAPAEHVHGYLGHEGRPPAELLEIGRTEVTGYGVEILTGRVVEVTGGDGEFAALLADGRAVLARRVLLATGLVDVLPEVPGVSEQWGRGVIHCPYCHGWEVRDRAVVVIGTGPASVHQAGLFRQLSDRVTLVVHDGADPDADARRVLGARGVRIVDGPVDEVVVGTAGEVTGVRLTGGDLLEADAVVVAPRMMAGSGPVAALGVTTEAVPMIDGEVVSTDPTGATVVPGIYAAGNAADAGHQVLQAAADGGRVGAMINADLVAADAAAAVHASDRSPAVEWDERYAADPAGTWSGRPNGALVAEMTGHRPRRALDVGCGEGADAVWLAQVGWDVTAVDVSRVALERGRAAAGEAGVDVRWRLADLTVEPPERDGYELVSVQYPALRRTPDDGTIVALLGAVAPGGTLLVVGHADVDHGHAHGFDPAEYVQPADVAAHLDGTWEVEVDEVRPRADPPPDSHHVDDVVLRARRR